MTGYTPSRVYPYPVRGDAPAGPEQIRDLAEAVDADVAGLAETAASNTNEIATVQSLLSQLNGIEIQTGTELVSFTDESSHLRTVAFPVAFSGPPVVVPFITSGSGSTARWDARSISPITSVSFDLFLYDGDSTTVVSWTDVTVSWIAIYAP